MTTVAVVIAEATTYDVVFGVIATVVSVLLLGVAIIKILKADIHQLEQRTDAGLTTLRERIDEIKDNDLRHIYEKVNGLCQSNATAAARIDALDCLRERGCPKDEE